MGKKKQLTISGETLEHAIREGLRRIGLPQTRTVIKILQRDRHSFLGDKEAVIAIVFDEEESNAALEKKVQEEFYIHMRLQFEESKIKLQVPGSFYESGFFKTNDDRAQFLIGFLASKNIRQPDGEFINKIASDPQSQHHFITVKTLETIPLNEEGASIFLEKAKDKMSARAILFHSGEIEEEGIYDALKEKGIVRGVLRNTLAEVIRKKHNGFFTIALGKEPIDDQPGSIEFFFQEDEHKQFAQMMQQLTIDTRSVKDINIVDRNQLLMRLGEPTQGLDGYDVEGTLLARTPAEDGALSLGPNVSMSDNGKEVYSKAAGHVVWKSKDRFIDIEAVYTVNGNVDFSEGNIVGFVGKVVVKGDVRPKFSVIAEGDVEIQGSVEDAVVESTKGSVFVGGSIVHQNEGYVQAKESVIASILTNATIRAKNITVDKEVMNSQLRASEKIDVSGNPGVIVGGVCKAKKLVRANTLGSESWVRTKVHVGDVTELNKYLKDIRTRIVQQKSQLQEAKEVVEMLSTKSEAGELSENQQEQLEAAKDQIPFLEEDIQYDEQEEEKINKEIDSQKNAKLEVVRTLYPHVDLNIFEGYYLPTEEEHAVGYHCREGLVISFPM